MRFTVFFCAVLALGLSCSPKISGAQSGPAVNVLVSVTDKQGKAVPNLKEADFKLREDGKVQVITSVSGASAAPLSIAFLVDQSGSTVKAGGEMTKALNAAIQFIRSTLQPGRDQVALATFKSTVTLQQSFTDNVDQMVQTMNLIAGNVGGGTAFNDAVFGASVLLERQPGRRLLLIVGDGDDTTSRISRSDAIKAARKADVWIVAIALANQLPAPFSRGEQSLEPIAKDSGGRFFMSSDLKQFDKIREELQGQYLIQYQSTNTKMTDEYRELRVEPVNKDYKVRHRSGYWVR